MIENTSKLTSKIYLTYTYILNTPQNIIYRTSQMQQPKYAVGGRGVWVEDININRKILYMQQRKIHPGKPDTTHFDNEPISIIFNIDNKGGCCN